MLINQGSIYCAEIRHAQIRHAQTGKERFELKKRILITGAAGELGQHTLRALASRGGPDAPELIALDLQRGTADGVTWRQDDLLTLCIRSLIRDGRFDAVIHLAAITSRKAEENPSGAERLNLDVSRQLLENCILQSGQSGPVRFIFTSSVAAIGRPAGAGVANESSQLCPSSVYGHTKSRCEALIRQANAQGHDAWGLRLPTLLLRMNPRDGPPSAGFLSDIGRDLINDGSARSPMPADFQVAVAATTEAAEALARLALDPLPAKAPAVINLPAFTLTPAELAMAVSRHRPGCRLTCATQPDPDILHLAGNWPVAMASRLADWLGDSKNLPARERLDRIVMQQIRP